jgi:hypothetical protein
MSLLVVLDSAIGAGQQRAFEQNRGKKDLFRRQMATTQGKQQTTQYGSSSLVKLFVTFSPSSLSSSGLS